MDEKEQFVHEHIACEQFEVVILIYMQTEECLV